MKRRAFTLIEILVVIGIIMVLLALLTAGFRHINRAAAARETMSELKVCRAILTEYENHAGLNAIEDSNPQVFDAAAPANTPRNFPVYMDIAPTIMIAPGKVYGVSNPYWPCLLETDLWTTVAGQQVEDMGDRSVAGNPRYASSSVGRTKDVMYILSHVPAFRTEIQNLPTKRLLEAAAGAAAAPPISEAVVLDGWGNPIIFVPRGGIHVIIWDRTTKPNPTPHHWLVRSTGTTNVDSGKDPAMTGAERPFFASAGQDGTFLDGADNVYSFQE